MGKDNVQMQQPGAQGWMQVPQEVPNCPKGLEYLSVVDQLIVHQQVELLEAFVDFESQNRYEIKNTMGQKIFMAAEDTGCCNRQICGERRSFNMKILDNYAQEVMHINRFLRCDTCWFPCCLQKMEISAPPGNIIGYVEQAWSICRPSYKILNAEEETILRVQGPCFTCAICGDIEFQVLTADGSQQIGEIRKAWSGFVKEAFTDADNFGVTFPVDLDVSAKATLMGAIFLIDFMFFERRGNKPEGPSVGMFS